MTMTARGRTEARTNLEQTKSLDLVLLIQGESVVDPARHDFDDGQSNHGQIWISSVLVRFGSDEEASRDRNKC